MNFLEASITPLSAFFGSAIVVVAVFLYIDILGKYEMRAFVVSALLLLAQAYSVKASLDTDTAWISIWMAGCLLVKIGMELLLEFIYTARRARRRRKGALEALPALGAVSPPMGEHLTVRRPGGIQASYRKRCRSMTAKVPE